MSSFRELAIAAWMGLAGINAFAQGQVTYTGIGRVATQAEVAAWDIDVRPDFKGLPKGAGSVNLGQDVWENRCASCHGVFGESNEVFAPLVGGTTAQDIQAGRVARLNDSNFPGRTTLMKASSVSTLWDYINRAMPWNAPKSLKTDEVYAVTAYLLNLGGVVPGDFTLSDSNIADVQKRLPNRDGMTTAHAMWPGKALGHVKSMVDVQATACMHACELEPKVASLLPEHARNNNGNLAEQQRLIGPQRGINTARASGMRTEPTSTVGAVVASPTTATALIKTHMCTACHSIDQKLVGPSFRQIAGKHGGRSDAEAYLTDKIKRGGSGVWGQVPMPAQLLAETDVKTIATWLAAGATGP